MEQSNTAYKKLSEALKSGNTGRCYIFYGAEMYLLMNNLSKLRRLICPDGIDGFNYKRFDGNIEIDILEDAIDTLPVFADKTMIEIHDYDVFSGERREQLCKLLSDLPMHVCVVFVYNTIEYKPDGRLKTTKEMLKNIEAVEFCLQKETALINWVQQHFRHEGKDISRYDAEYLIRTTGGLMATLDGEIKKVSAYAQADRVVQKDIDAVVIPALDSVVYKLTDHIVKRNHKAAMHTLDTLLRMREAPHKLFFSISLKMRQLLAACICLQNKTNKDEFMKMCGIINKHEFIADLLLKTARTAKLSYCRNAVLLCSQTAVELNSTSESEACIIELVAKLVNS